MCLPGIGSFGIFHKTMTAAMPLISDLDFPLFSLATVSILFLREKKNTFNSLAAIDSAQEGLYIYDLQVIGLCKKDHPLPPVPSIQIHLSELLCHTIPTFPLPVVIQNL